jgi:hypothetical protein
MHGWWTGGAVLVKEGLNNRTRALMNLLRRCGVKNICPFQASCSTLCKWYVLSVSICRNTIMSVYNLCPLISDDIAMIAYIYTCINE